MDKDSLSVLLSVLSKNTQVLIALLGFLIAILTWYLNERSKRTYDEYKRKEERYIELIKGLRGFYVVSENKELQTQFLHQLNLCWMYCPDEIINKAKHFLSTVRTNCKYSDEAKERAVGELILAMRKDLIDRKPLKRTELKPDDFKHYRAT